MCKRQPEAALSLPQALKFLVGDIHLPQDPVVERWPNLASSMNRDCNGPAIFVGPSFVTAGLTLSLESQSLRYTRNSSARALGMHYLGGVMRQRQSFLAILCRNHLKDLR
jgi:hypothetical protein